MTVTALARGEKRLLIAAAVLACLLGGLAAYAAYLDEAEAQFHGGVLEEDALKAQLALVWEPAYAFARWGSGIFLALGVAPVAMRRFFRSPAGAAVSTGSALTLPYAFDTTGVVRVILQGTLGVLAVVIVGILYSFFVSHSTAAALQLLVIGVVAAVFGRVFLRNLTGARGIVTREAVLVEPGRVCGIRLPGPAGTFPIGQFRAVQVQRSFGPLRTAQAPRWHERVYLMGKPGTPDIIIARTALDAGVTMGHELAAALGLPYLEEVVPF